MTRFICLVFFFATVSACSDAQRAGEDDPRGAAHARRTIRHGAVRSGQYEEGAAGAAISGARKEAHPVHHLRVLAPARLVQHDHG